VKKVTYVDYPFFKIGYPKIMHLVPKHEFCIVCHAESLRNAPK
jgi:nitrate/TMAO reductase-like tetraheme cytochrome c subunit